MLKWLRRKPDPVDTLLHEALDKAERAKKLMWEQQPAFGADAWMAADQAVLYVNRAVADLADARRMFTSKDTPSIMSVYVNGQPKRPIEWIDAFQNKHDWTVLEKELLSRALTANQIKEENVSSFKVNAGNNIEIILKKA
jgi:hypothetical protein